MTKKTNIFVQIASYRDSELVPTIKDCINNAKNIDNISFGICVQYGDELSEEDRLFLSKLKNSKILYVKYTESSGACWARHKTNELYDNEEFTLQIDSHMRFIENWDTELINMWESLNDTKAILTAYPAEYYPDKEKKEWKHQPHIIHVYSMKNGQTEQRPKTPNNWQSRTVPYKAIHVAAGFIFAPGQFIHDVPYDPEFYFSGEETSLALRSFTHGYNLYHPHKIILWHYYTRKDQVKHWTDHKDWSKLSSRAHDRLNCLLGRNNKYDLGKYGLGTCRTLEDYQNYSGIDYKRKILHLDTIDALEPPVDISKTDRWSYTMKKFNKKIRWKHNTIDSCKDPRFWALIIKDKNDHELYRKDLVYKDYKDIIDGKISEITIEFDYYFPFQEPNIALIWPYSESKGWLSNTKWKI
jgi:hypothetical protein